MFCKIGSRKELTWTGLSFRFDRAIQAKLFNLIN
jgi:hypothetical protein